MKAFYLNTKNIAEWKTKVSCGDKIYLSGTAYTARDAAHKRIFEIINNGTDLPFDIKNSVIYYAGPTPAPEGRVIGSCGPTTSMRMDSFAATLYDMGMACTIGKGPRSSAVTDSIIKNGGLYLCAIGGAGALAAQSVTQCEVIAFNELGCESIKKVTLKDFPLFVGIDSFGNSLF